MANIRVKDLDSKASFASDDEILMDSPSGTGTMLRDAFIAAVAAIMKASPGTYGLATLDGGGKLTSSQDPSQAVSYKGTHNASTNSPALADGSGVAGDTYQVNVAGTRNYGSGSLTLAVGDALVYNGSIWQQVSGVANILDGVSTPSAAQAALEVISQDESMEIAATKVVRPALRFSTDDYIAVADSDKLSFTSGTDDTGFSIAGFINMEDATSFPIVGKYGSGASAIEYIFTTTAADKLQLLINDAAGLQPNVLSDNALTSYQGKKIHVAACYSGSGPNSGAAFSNAASEMSLYINGKLIDSTATNNASYAGMSNTTQELRIGRGNALYAKGHIYGIKIFNRKLTAAEVAQLAKGSDLGFADEWGGATATSGSLVVGKRYRLRDWITGDDFTNVGAASNADGVEFIATGTTPTTWTNSSVVENIGTLADFRAEDFNESAGKLLDRSSNNFVGTNNGATLVGACRHISADTIDLKNLPTSSAGLSAGEVWSNGGVLTVV